MPSSSRDSDIHPDRIQAREDQYRRDVQARAPSPVAKRGVDMTELGSIGAHFDMFEYEPWPHSLELTDHDALSGGSIPTTTSTNTSIHSPNNPASSTADGSPISRACTPMKCDAYLPEHEYEELQRQNSVNKRRRISVSTTVEPMTQDEHDEDDHIETYRPCFSSHTPSHCSRALTDKEGYIVKNVGPSSPGPWSQFGRTVGTSDRGDLRSNVLHYQGVAE
ncbi:hypothetical protein BKA58DRAFT_403622 [Alternaria rosae]|uniref:uncharacterized protein n=1 Tax=Alternaria rosae TaxID=1187941 RepID=UPI001E8DF85B|nr:uncharacterized protein BKA58DRAFT_403622 [Alternaria rosae]KAH6866778.1 hypothetical protein BKA58DRAFT_403622 [Alternaria rosae]